MNYSTAYKLGKNDVKQFKTTQVVGADGSDLGAVGTLQCKIIIGDIEVEQTFIVCQHLRRNVILGTDFAKQNQAGVSWTQQGTRILSVKGVTRWHSDTKLDPDCPPSATTCLGEFTRLGNVFGTSTLGTACCSSGKSVKLTGLREFGQIMQPVTSLEISF